MKMFRNVFAAFILMSVSGCAEMTHLTRTRPLTDRTAILIDAKQRGIFTSNNVMCAEPSPDALSAIAASQNLNLTTSEGTTLGQSLSIAEAAGSLGLRTQSIQLMRDHMYRLCEAYQSGAIPPLTFQILHRRFQSTMVGILAIEQLTGAVRAPAIVLGGSAAAGNAEAVTRLTASRETQAAQVAEAERDVAAKRTADTSAKQEVARREQALASAADETARTAATTELTNARNAAQSAAGNLLAAEGVLAGRRAALAAIDRALVLAQSTSSASASGTIETVSGSNLQLASVASAVQDIVRSTMQLDNNPDFCAMLLSEAAYVEDPRRATRIDRDGPVVGACLARLGSGSVTLN